MKNILCAAALSAVLVLCLGFSCNGAGKSSDDGLKRTGLLRVRIYMEKEDWANAEAELMKIHQKYGDNPEVLYDLGTVCRNLNRLGDAEKYFTKLVTNYAGGIRDPQYIQYVQGLAQTLFDMEKYGDVIARLGPLENNGYLNESPMLKYLLASSYEMTGREESAETLFAWLREYKPRDTEERLLLAEVYLKGKMIDLAITCLKQVLDDRTLKDDVRTRALKLMGGAWYEKDGSVAMGYLDQALELDRNDFEIAYQLGDLCYAAKEKEKNDKAEGYYSEALARLKKLPSESIYEKRCEARILYRLKRVDDAMALYRQVVPKAPQSPEDVDIINDYAEALIDQKDYDEAIKQLDLLKPMEEEMK